MSNTDIDQTIIENPANASEKEKGKDGVFGPQLPFVEQWKDRPAPKGKRKMTPEEKALVRDLLTGTGAGAAVFFAEQNRWSGAFGGTNGTEAETPPAQPEELKAIIKDCAPMAETAGLDNLNYQQAYDAARAEVGAGGFFEWRGQIFNTYTAEEWNGMTDEQRGQFADSIDYQAPEPEPVRYEIGNGSHRARRESDYAGLEENDNSGGNIPVSEASFEQNDTKPEVEVVSFDMNKNNMPETFALNADEDSFAEGLIVDRGEQHQNFIMLADENNNDVYDHVYEIDGTGNIQSRKEISEAAGLGANIGYENGQQNIQFRSDDNYRLLTDEEMGKMDAQPLPSDAQPKPEIPSPENPAPDGDMEIEAEIRERRELYQTSLDSPANSDSALAQNDAPSASDVLMRDAQQNPAEDPNAPNYGTYSYEMEQTAFDANSFDNNIGGDDSYQYDFA